jgi:hypothetical protein
MGDVCFYLFPADGKTRLKAPAVFLPEASTIPSGADKVAD